MNSKLRIRLLAGLLMVCLAGGIALSAQRAAAPAPARSTGKPFLWRIDGPVPSYLYGTIHVPDPHVLELPEVVRKAIDASDVLYTEIPLDPATQAAMVPRLMLPPDQDLRKLVGDEIFARFIRVLTNALGSKLPPGAAEILAASFAHMKPWVAMSQVELLDYLPDVLAGEQPLDAVLHGMAVQAGKEVGALETVDEQFAVFDSLTTDEQVRLMAASLDEIEKPRPGQLNSARQLVSLYLAGDLDPLAAELTREEFADEALKKKVTARLIDGRNTRMADRIAARCAAKPARSYFFAVGALHYAGNTGIIAQLTKKGFKVTRVGSSI